MKNYIYKLKHKYIKHPEILETLGFNVYKSEEDGETFYAMGIKLSKDCSIVQYLIKAFEKIYSKASETEREEFKEYTFSKKGKLRFNKKISEEFTKCQLCIVDKGIGENTLFINAPDKIEYYNTKVLDECIPDIINCLLKNDVIYKKRVRHA